MFKPFLAAAAAMALVAPAHAVIVTQWNFNSVVPDGSTGTGTTIPSTGVGTAALVGGTTASFASGDASGGSSDPASGDDSAWNTTTYAAQGTGDKTRGASFAVSTVGYQDILLSFDLRHSNTSSRFGAVQYTTDGSAWLDLGGFDADAGGDTWYARSFDFSAVDAADNNASFAVRVLSTFAPGTPFYAATTSGSNYGTAGTWRFDMVTISAAPIPEPGTYALLLAGLAAVGFMVRRRG